MNAQFRARKWKRICSDSNTAITGWREWIERSAASEGVLAALQLSKSAQSADKVHFSDSSGPMMRPWKPFAVPFGSGHNQSFPSNHDQLCAFFITNPLSRRKNRTHGASNADLQATSVITLPARGFSSKPAKNAHFGEST